MLCKNFYVTPLWYFRGWVWCHFFNYCLSVVAISGCLRHMSWPHPSCPRSLTQGTCFSHYFHYTIYHAHAKSQRPITCLSFTDITNLAQQFEGVACEKTISVKKLDLNRKYRILRAKRLTTRFDPTVEHTIRDAGAASAQIFLRRWYSDVIKDTSAKFGGWCGTITLQTVWYYLAQIHLTCLVVAMICWRFCARPLVRYIMYCLRNTYFEKKTIMSLKLKLQSDTK